MPNSLPEQILAEAPKADLNDPTMLHHGGPFAAVKPGNSGLATMNIIDDTKRDVTVIVKLE